MGRRSALVVAAGLAAAIVGASAGAAQTRLVISGAFHTTSAQAVSTNEEGCGFRTRTRTLLYESEALRTGRGPAVARVELTIPHFRGRGRYDARIPAPYSRTAVQVVTGRNATTGVAGGFYVARSGSVTVLHARNVGRRGRSGSVTGTVHARLRLQHGSKRLRLDGSWRCRIDPTANGG